MLQAVFALRYLMLIASFGAVLGAILMFWEGTAKLAGAVRALIAEHGSSAEPVLHSVLGAMDAFLFGIVLVIFAGAIAVGLVVELSPEDRQRLPAWIRVDGIAGLKHALVGVVLLYLVVDFATDVAEAGADPSWESLVLPISVLLIAAAFRVFQPPADRQDH